MPHQFFFARKIPEPSEFIFYPNSLISEANRSKKASIRSKTSQEKDLKELLGGFDKSKVYSFSSYPTDTLAMTAVCYIVRHILVRDLSYRVIFLDLSRMGNDIDLTYLYDDREFDAIIVYNLGDSSHSLRFQLAKDILYVPSYSSKVVVSFSKNPYHFVNDYIHHKVDVTFFFDESVSYEDI